MFRNLRAGIFLGGMLLSTLCQGQFAPLGTMPMYYNSSFAGGGDVPRFNTILIYEDYRNFNSIGSQSSFDMFVPAIGSGIGITSGISRFGGIWANRINYNLGLAIAPKFSLGGKVTISPSIDVMLLKGVSSNFTYNGVNSRAGLLVNTSKFFVGYSMNFFSLYKHESSYSTETIKRNFTDSHEGMFQMGYTFQRSTDSKFSVTPQILAVVNTYTQTGRLGIGFAKFLVNFRYNKFLYGVSDDGLHVGYQSQRLRIMAFNNVQRFLIRESPVNSSTLSFRYNFKK